MNFIHLPEKVWLLVIEKDRTRVNYLGPYDSNALGPVLESVSSRFPCFDTCILCNAAPQKELVAELIERKEFLGEQPWAIAIMVDEIGPQLAAMN